jgi:hypothetical protein
MAILTALFILLKFVGINMPGFAIFLAETDAGQTQLCLDGAGTQVKNLCHQCLSYLMGTPQAHGQRLQMIGAHPLTVH